MSDTLGILIVDDHAATRSLLRAILRAEGWSVLGEASTAEQGFESLRQLKPDVVCLDVVMPGESGVAVLQRMKAEAPRTAIVMITGSATPEVVKTALGTGADGFLVKPFDRGRIVQTVRDAVQKYRPLS